MTGPTSLGNSPARPRVAVVIPTLNEEEAIGGVVAAIPPGLADRVIVADSGSTDRTVEHARAAGARVVSLRERGYGEEDIAKVAHANWLRVLRETWAQG